MQFILIFFRRRGIADCVLQIFDMVHKKGLEIHPNIGCSIFALVYGNMIGSYVEGLFFPEREHVIDMRASISYIFDIRIWNYPSLTPLLLLCILLLLLFHFFMEITFSLENFKWDLLQYFLYLISVWYQKWKKKNEERTGEKYCADTITHQSILHPCSIQNSLIELRREAIHHLNIELLQSFKGQKSPQGIF